MLLGLLVLLALPLAGHGAAPTVVRVRSATQGAGTPTTEEGLSFGSLRLARDHLRRLPATATDVQLLLGRGTHRLTAPLRFGPRETAGRTVRITGDPAAGAVISGGLAITGWLASPQDKGVLEAPLPGGLLEPPRQLYVGGARAERTDHAANATVAGLGASSGANVTADGLTTESSAPLSWPDPPTVELRHDAAYEQSRCRVASVSAKPGGEGALVKMVQPCWEMGVATGQMSIPSAVLNIGGANRLLPGQWWGDRARRTVLYRPRDATESASLLAGAVEVEAPLSQGLIEVEGTSGLSLEGITFTHSAWDVPNSPDGYLERYGGVRYLSCGSVAAKETGSCYTPNGSASACAAGCCGAAKLGGCSLRMAEAAVSFRGCSNIAVNSCTFHQLGGWGLALTGATSKSRVSHNHFYDSSGGAVYLGDVNETSSAVAAKIGKPSELMVSDNLIEWIGQEYQGSSGIHLFSAVDSVVEHNRLHHTPYTSITFVWPVPQADSWNRNLSMTANDVADPSYWGGDGGAVHTLATCVGCQLRGNYFHDQRHGSKCTYIDNGSSDYTITDHVVDNATVSLWLYYQQGCGPHCSFAGRDQSNTYVMSRVSLLLRESLQHNS